MGGGPSKEELEHKEYMERKRLERQKEENEHKERMKGKLNLTVAWIFECNSSVDFWIF